MLLHSDARESRGSSTKCFIRGLTSDGVKNNLAAELNTPREFNALIVEDNRDLAQLFSNLLSVLGGKTEIAVSAESAIEKAGNILPDIVFCDLLLPGGKSGIDFAREFRGQKEFERIPLIAVTGQSLTELHASSELGNFDEVFEKPVKFAHILKVLQNFHLC